MPQRISSLPCGAKIKFGSYSVNGEAAHKIRWIKVASNDTILLTENLEDFRAFDSPEPYNPQPERQNYGNNYYPLSNIDLFLNSGDDEWYSPRHDYDSPPDKNHYRDAEGHYDNHPGFLAYFKTKERDAIIPTEITTVISHADTTSESHTSEKINRKVFLPSTEEIVGVGKWDYFINHTNKAYPSPQAVSHTQHVRDISEENNTYYYLRDARISDSHQVAYITPSGYQDHCYACHSILGIRPALTLNPRTLVTNETDEQGYYHVIISKIAPNEVLEEKFLSII